MGILTEGEALTPEEMRDASAYIREHGVTQFLHTWERDRDLHDDELKFGDEIECGLYVVDSVNKTVKISLRSAELRAQLDEKEGLYRHETESCTWHPEFGAWMIESTPSRPYSHYTTDLIRVERNMVLRRRRLLSLLKDNEIAPTVVNFPLLGAGDFVVDGGPFSAPHSQSAFIPDDIINPHPRFAALTRNIRARRGQKVDIQVPLYRDTHTPEFSPSFNPADPAAAAAAAELPPGYRVEPDGFIHMDAMGFGMGMNCLQVTFQARDVDESRYMYDQLAVLAPIMLAMTAATPIFKGRLAATDARWSTIAQSVDDRTPAERGELSEEQVAAAADPRLSGDGIQRIPKSRYDSISTYIYHCRGDTACHRTFAVYNDVECPVDEKVKTRLRAAGIDENLAHHIAHLFCRDPISAFHGLIELDDEKSTDHFESIQSTNWQTCRWKPPPPRLTEDDPHIGWRTEFRSMEVQLTDFENAAFTVFVVLVTRVLLAFDLSFYIPLSKVDENMRRAHVADAVNTQKFFFRRHIAPPEDHSTVIRERSTADLASLAKQLGAGGGLPTPPLPHSPLGVEGVEVEGVDWEAQLRMESGSLSDAERAAAVDACHLCLVQHIMTVGQEVRRLGAGIVPLTPEEDVMAVQHMHRMILRAVGRCKDASFYLHLGDRLAKDHAPQLLAVRSPHVETYLRARDPQLLHAYYHRHGNFLEAANLMSLLARDEADVSIEQRIAYLGMAVASAEKAVTGSSDAHLICENLAELRDTLDIAAHQQMAHLQLGAEFSSYNYTTPANRSRFSEAERRPLDLLERVVHQSQYQLMSITQLFHEVCTPYKLWELCLLLLHISKHDDADLMARLWRSLIFRIVPEDAQTEEGRLFLQLKREAGRMDVDKRHQRRDVLFEASEQWQPQLGERVTELAKQLGPLSPAFPSLLVLEELEELAATLFVCTGAGDRGFTARCLREVGFTPSALLEAYMEVFGRWAGKAPEKLLQALSSAVYVLLHWGEDDRQLLQAVRSGRLSGVGRETAEARVDPGGTEDVPPLCGAAAGGGGGA
eukprot:CAMPEP_0173290756 /NCGR_PEP_ID=MMETSP1143-20121109/11746_1 /TAXON_ID=483371 /ORGANISM="non described non described, Strain CCMP2298" /LENGTH=1044 /DNA_ID=CAMNT_0014229861 /DNA_START=142 /DNA_END=3271 /DNA_ORIENTATION=-